MTEAEIALAHAKDDHELIRTRVLRKLLLSVDLLNEGLLAIKRDQPKIHVMIDHSERVMDDLRKEIALLQNCR